MDDVHFLTMAFLSDPHVPSDAVQEDSNRNCKWIRVLVVHQVSAKGRKVIKLHDVIVVTFINTRMNFKW